jgi:type I restriction enzyme S subunit
MGFESCSCTLIPANSIIISTRAPIGHIAITKKDVCFNQGCKGILLKDSDVDINFLYYQIRSRKGELNQLGTGTTFLELSKSSLENFNINIPSLEEQQSIVKMLENEYSILFNLKGMISNYQQKVLLMIKSLWD